ncbi:MAG: topoisomerase [Thermoleophilaceae bacterium]|nr:topoisomerase [Thermoleophilaceae bacterium]
MLRFAEELPRSRRRIASDLALPGMPRERALACAVRLLDRGSLRIGSEQYAEENETYGVSTLQPGHVALDGPRMDFTFVGKGSITHERSIRDAAAADVIRRLKGRRGATGLLAYKTGRRWCEINAEQINAYVKEQVGPRFSAKDFRTWNGTVMAAIALAGLDPGDKRAVRTATGIVAAHLGNTPAVCRKSYIDPRVIDRFLEGQVIGLRLPRLDRDQTAPRIGPAVERATLELIADGSVAS